MEHFSLESYVADWSRHRDTVTVEGTLSEDGDYFVIDRDPANPGTLVRVRKADVVEYANLRSSSLAVGECQHHRVIIKRGSPVQQIAVVRADDLSPVAARARRSHSVLARNPSPARFESAGYAQDVFDIDSDMRIAIDRLSDGHDFNEFKATLLNGRYRPQEVVEQFQTHDPARWNRWDFIHHKDEVGNHFLGWCTGTYGEIFHATAILPWRSSYASFPSDASSMYWVTDDNITFGFDTWEPGSGSIPSVELRADWHDTHYACLTWIWATGNRSPGYWRGM